ncbi:helicase-associated domain-containing protein [Rhizohabitans arisaemae]|uniref:helicase-associated domain-containing protein n=1 Tax=Rhizohabitans arisaemae TaxID=2720610 RepID=UPI0024B21D96|nr:helicase-associated domain-containing protein [Rhizohabitans arisaemae]
MDDRLLDWLSTLDEDRLTRVLTARPDALSPPWPRRLPALAERLEDAEAVLEAAGTLPLPCMEIAQACLVLGAGCSARRLASFLGADEAELRPFLDRLADHALAWTDRSGRIHLVRPLARNWVNPCGFGRTSDQLLSGLPVYELRSVARALGLAVSGHRDRLTAEIIRFHGDPEAMAGLMERAPEGVDALLEGFLTRWPVQEFELLDWQRAGTPEHWAVRHGLIRIVGWRVAEMPREVALTLRGPGYRAPFTPRPPGAVPREPLEHEASAAAIRLLDRVTGLLGNLAGTPLPVLRKGGVGVREVRRVAKETGCTEDETRLFLEITAVARLHAWSEEAQALTPTDRFDEWRLASPAERLTELLSAWWRMERSPLRLIEGKRPPVLGEEPYGELIVRVRHATLRALPTDDLPAAVRWYAPLIRSEVVDECAPAAFAEAALLGLVGGQTIAELGGALAGLSAVAGTEWDGYVPAVARHARLGEIAGRMLAAARRTALFGADLTAVVTGPASAELAEVLDLAADRETQGTASVWRFRPGSVRRALDDGWQADRLLDALKAVATGEIPQPLDYLVRDVARRHGEVRVLEPGCCVAGDDPALLAEIASHRKLARLRLRLLAPTVLASVLGPEQTLAALREAGYAPVAERSPDSVRAKPRPPVKSRAHPVRTGRAACPVDPREHAARLIAVGTALRARGQTWAVIGRHAFRLPPAQQAHLGFVVDRGVAARVTGTDGFSATVSFGELDGEVLDAWCDETGDYRRFPLGEIVEVAYP